MVCLGNICRSPTAEAAVREAAATERFDIVVESAGTAAWHVGNRPDARSRAAAQAAGLHVDGAAQQVTTPDFDRFDLVVAMDASNLADLRRIAPPGGEARLRLFRDYADAGRGLDVPDPYHGGPDGFREVVEICRAASAGLVAALQADSA